MPNTAEDTTAGHGPHPPQDAPRRRAVRRWAALFLGLVAAFLVDEPVMRAIYPIHAGRFAVAVLNSVRWLGNGRLQLPVLLLLLVFGALANRRLLRAGAWGLLAFVISGLAANGLKVLVHRPRPYTTVQAPSHWLQYAQLHEFQSFPSGDASTTFAIAATIGWIFPRAFAPLLVVGGVVAAGRVVVGVHHPSDVWAGAMLGLAVGRLMLWASRPRAVRDALAHAWPYLLLTVSAGLVFLSGLGRLPLFGRDESLYLEAAREMYARGDWIVPRVNGVPFFEKPPLLYWLAAGGYHTFGVSPFSGRLPAALLGLATVLLTAGLGARVWGKRAGLLAGLALASSLQVAVIGRMGIMDVPLMSLTTLGLLAYAAWRLRGGMRYAAAFGAFVGLAVLLKSLAGLLPVVVAGGHALLARPVKLRPWVVPALVAALVAAAVAVPWFATLRGHYPAFWSIFVRENFARMNQPMQGHGGGVLYLLYYPALLLISFFPWVAFLPGAKRSLSPLRGPGWRSLMATQPRRGPSAALRVDSEAKGEAARLWRGLAITWFWVTLLAFSLISTKLPGYVTPLFPAMALLVGAELDQQVAAPGRAPWIAALAGAGLLATLVALLPWAGAKLGVRVGAAEEARRLVTPAYLWAAAYGIIAVGAILGLARRPRAGIGVMAVGQTAAVAVVLAGILPILSPFMEGAREYRLTQLAQRELPRAKVVLYETRPEAVCFVLGREVATYGKRQEQELRDSLSNQQVALLAPEQELPTGLPAGRQWKVGNYVLLEIRPRQAGR